MKNVKYKKPADLEKWIVISPQNINTGATKQQGRRLPINECVENPTGSEIQIAISGYLPAVLEQKESGNGTDPLVRVRVQVLNESGNYINFRYHDRPTIYRLIAQNIHLYRSL